MPLRVTLTRAPQSDAHTLATFSFGGDLDGTVQHPGLTPLGERPVYELWRTVETVTQGREGVLAWRATSTLLFGSICTSLADDPTENTRLLYRHVLASVRRLGFPHLLRIWNFMPQINAGQGDQERYKCFSLGRARALDESVPEPVSLPAATAVGTHSGDRLLVYFLASREAGRRLENPRQVSAFDYPRRYGPRSPLFSRAAIYPGGGDVGQALMLVSGTASIVGHESRHAGDLDGQLHETWRNLEHLCTKAGTAYPQSLRVYIRHAEDYAQVAGFLAERLPDGAAAVYLQADICRAELLVEIEGVYRVATAPR